MNDNAKKWVEALRSGRYEQGAGKLRYNDSFCCLGVACHLSADELELEVKVVDGLYKYNDNGGYLPIAVKEWLGITEGLMLDLVDMNDNGRSFDEIANQIEENL
jgi:hypothetical protein